MSNPPAVFYRDLTRAFPVATRAKGCWIEDAEGKRYLDAVGGAFVASVGHGVREVADAMARQAATLAYVNGTAFTHEAVEGLASRLIARSPGLGKAYILGSGSEAVEGALKLARQVWAERGRPEKHRIIALSPAYHGNTLLALSASARPRYSAAWGEWLVDVRRIPAPYAYRCGCNDAADCPACTGSALEQAIVEEGAENVAAFIMEPIGGSSTGASVPRDGWLSAVREICTRHSVFLIADEVLCGAGRTGTWTACGRAGVVPDIMVLGKGIAGGYAPVSAVLARDELVDTLASGSGALLHAQTFSHHPVMCAAANATLDYMEEHRLVERCATMARRFHSALDALRELPAVGDVRGVGLLAGVEFVADRETRAAFPRARRVAERFTRAAQDAGLIVWPNVGHANNGAGDLVMLAPPLIITDDEIGGIVARFTAAARAVFD